MSYPFYMVNFDDGRIEKEILRCSRCSLCQSVCPVFKKFKNECFSAKGKLMFLRGVFSKKLKPTKKMLQYFKSCKNCTRCSNFCPSAIDLNFIFAFFKYKFFKPKTLSFKLFFIETKFIFMKFFLNRFEVCKIAKKSRQISKIKTKQEVVFFENCYQKHFCVVKNFEKFEEYFCIQKSLFSCCNLQAFFEGAFDDFQKAMKKNVKILNSETKKIVFDCSDCIYAFKVYQKYFDSNFKCECLHVFDFVLQNVPEFLNNKVSQSTIFLVSSKFNSNFKQELLKYARVEEIDFFKTELPTLDKKYFENINKLICIDSKDIIWLEKHLSSKKIKIQTFIDFAIESLC